MENRFRSIKDTSHRKLNLRQIRPGEQIQVTALDTCLPQSLRLRLANLGIGEDSVLTVRHRQRGGGMLCIIHKGMQLALRGEQAQWIIGQPISVGDTPAPGDGANP